MLWADARRQRSLQHEQGVLEGFGRRAWCWSRLARTRLPRATRPSAAHGWAMLSGLLNGTSSPRSVSLHSPGSGRASCAVPSGIPGAAPPKRGSRLPAMPETAVGYVIDVLIWMSVLCAFLTLVTFSAFSDLRTYPIKLIMYLCGTIIGAFSSIFFAKLDFVYQGWLCCALSQAARSLPVLLHMQGPLRCLPTTSSSPTLVGASPSPSTSIR